MWPNSDVPADMATFTKSLMHNIMFCAVSYALFYWFNPASIKQKIHDQYFSRFFSKIKELL